MKTLKEFESNKIDLSDVFGGKGANPPTMNVTYTVYGPMEFTGTWGEKAEDLINNPNAVMGIEFDEAIQ